MRRPPLITAASLTVALGALAWLVKRELSKPWPDLGPLTSDAQDGPPPPGPSCLLCGDLDAHAPDLPVLRTLSARVCTTCAHGKDPLRLAEEVMRERAAAPVRTCVGCGCTDDRACYPTGCSWMAPGHSFCSRCHVADIASQVTNRG